MSISPEELIKLAANLESLASESLESIAKEKSSKKLDPKAKVRNRGNVCVPAESAKDKKDHFPINSEDQARNALSRVHQYSSVPEWYSGSLKGLQSLVARKVKAKYPKINVGGKEKKKSAFDHIDELFVKIAQQVSFGVGLPNASKAQLRGLIANLQKSNPALSTELQTAFRTLSGQSTADSATQSTYYVPENVVNFLPTLDKVKVAVNGTPDYDTAVALYDLFKRMTVRSAAPASGGRGGGLPVRQDVRDAQNQLWRAHPDFAQALENSGGVDGKLGPTTIRLLKEFLPRMETEQAVKYLSEEENKKPALEQLPPPEEKKQSGPPVTWKT